MRRRETAPVGASTMRRVLKKQTVERNAVAHHVDEAVKVMAKERENDALRLVVAGRGVWAEGKFGELSPEAAEESNSASERIAASVRRASAIGR